MQFRLIRNVEELSQIAEAWNRLLAKSDVSLPTLRAEVLIHWARFFRCEEDFSAIVVEDGNAIVAALPLMHRVKKKILPVATLAKSDWAETADLLMARDCDHSKASWEMAKAIRNLNVPLLWIDGVPFDNPSWQALIVAMNDQNLKTHVELKHYVGLVEIEKDWERYHQRLSKGHRKKLRKANRLALLQGQLHFMVLRNLSQSQIRAALQEGFEVEHRSWKSESGTSVLATDGMLDYYVESAMILADAGALEILNLRLDGKLIAFEMGYVGKGTYYSFKIGYDAEFASLSPGQLLMAHQIEACIDGQDRRWIDTVGIMSDATSKWATHCAPRGRVMLSTGVLGNQVIKANQHLVPLYRKLRQRDVQVHLPKLGPGPQPPNSEIEFSNDSTQEVEEVMPESIA